MPLLSRIPWVGGLFRWRSDTQEKTNLMVFLRPTILRSQAERVEAGGRAYEGLRNADDSTLPDDARRMFDTRRLPDAHRPRP
ncbi:Type II secretion system protein D precursor [compost metagenome]